MKKPIAIAAAVLAIGAAGTAVAAPGGSILGGSQDERQAEFAGDLAKQLDGVNANQVEQGLEKVRTQHEAEMKTERAEGLADQLDGVSVDQATAALTKVDAQLKSDQQNGERPDPNEVDKLLADELGVSADELKTAHQAEATARLDQAVEDGKLTEKQADKIRKDIKSGKMPPGGPGGHGGPGGPGGPGEPGAPDGAGPDGPGF